MGRLRVPLASCQAKLRGDRDAAKLINTANESLVAQILHPVLWVDDEFNLPHPHGRIGDNAVVDRPQGHRSRSLGRDGHAHRRAGNGVYGDAHVAYRPHPFFGSCDLSAECLDRGHHFPRF